MGSLTRRIRKRAPVEAYAVKRLPAVPATGTVTVPSGQTFDPKSVEVFVGGHRIEMDDIVPVESGSSTPVLIVDPIQRRRPNPMQLIALMATLGTGLESARRR